jgi:hypothetical protein
MSRKRDAIRALSDAETAYFAAGNARQRAAQPLHDRARELVARQVLARCGDVLLFPNRVGTPSGTLRLTPALTAGVDHAGAIRSRVTMTRLVATGIFALALQKKEDERELFLYIDAPDGQHVEPCPPNKQVEVRRFAAQVTTAARERHAYEPTTDEHAFDKESRALLAEFEALDSARSDLDAARDTVRTLEQAMLDAGTMPGWHQSVEERGVLLPLRMYLLPERDSNAPPTTAKPAAPEATAGRMIIDQLEALAALRASGALTQGEFERAKALVLADPAA